MSNPNINVNVSGPVQPTSTYKTKVLKGNHSFASQVTEPNMKYVIKHDFVLDGDVTIPANCVLEFDGGSVSGEQTITGQNTCIQAGLVKILGTDVTLAGTWNVAEAYPEWFGAKGDGVTDCAEAINKTIDSFRGIIRLITGIYSVSSTIILSNNRLLIGNGAGNYLRGTAYNRITIIKPSADFVGDRVISADPKDFDDATYYIFGIAIRDLCIDCYNISSLSKTIIALMSVTNTETFDSIRVINNDNNIALWIDKSQNQNALESDGIIISNLYCLDSSGTNHSTNPVGVIGACNEVSIRDSKFQRGSDAPDGSVALLINAKYNGAINKAANGVTIDSCSFTSAEYGVKIVGNSTDANGPRYIRVFNCTWEACKYQIKTESDDANKPVQFCVFGFGNRFNTYIPVDGVNIGIVLGDNSANNVVYASDDQYIKTEGNSINAFIFGGGANSLIDASKGNIWVHKTLADGFQVNRVDKSNFYPLVQSWVNVAAADIKNGWARAYTNRNALGYFKDPNDIVHIRGMLKDGTSTYPTNLIFTLPSGYRPIQNVEIVCGVNVTKDGNDNITNVVHTVITIQSDGEVRVTGAGQYLRLDEISFSIK